MSEHQGSEQPADEIDTDEHTRGDERTSDAPPTSAEGAAREPLQPHGDPLLASAQGRNDGDDGSRHGWAATAGIGQEGTQDFAGDSDDDERG